MGKGLYKECTEGEDVYVGKVYGVTEAAKCGESNVLWEGAGGRLGAMR